MKEIIRRPGRKITDQTGRRFGRLVVVELVERSPTRDHLWRCRCDCGAEKIARHRNMVSGHTTSCGCAFRDVLVQRNTTHGLTRKHPREYRSWKDMRARCNTPTDSDYADYGGRGIKVCERWDDFAAFFADMGPRPDRHTLDRADVNGNYEPSNCRWADDWQQANNRRSNVRLEMDGQAKTLAQWCAEYGIDRTKVSYRLKQGWPLAEALRTDIDGRRANTNSVSLPLPVG